jgi:hypothetical protein
VSFRANLSLGGYATSAAGVFTGPGIFDNQPELGTGVIVEAVSLWQRVDGLAATTTTVELYRYDIGAGVWAQITTAAPLSLAAGGGANARIISAAGLNVTLQIGDRLGVLFTSLQGVPGADACVTVLFG